MCGLAMGRLRGRNRNGPAHVVHHERGRCPMPRHAARLLLVVALLVLVPGVGWAQDTPMPEAGDVTIWMLPCLNSYRDTPATAEVQPWVGYIYSWPGEPAIE